MGDDIAWLRPGADGRLWAVNPEAGFFGVVPGTGPDTNPNALATIARDTIFTNVAVTPDGVPWWEGKDKSPPADLLDWQGQPWDRDGQGRAPQLALHRGRPAVPVDVARAGRTRRACPSRRSSSAAVGRGSRPSSSRAATGRTASSSGATMGSETTAAATGAGGRGATRPDGDAALLRLQHGRLLRALAGDGPRPGAPAGDLPRELVPHRRRRPLRVAGLRREPARAAVDDRPREGEGRRRRRRRSAWCRPSRRSTGTASRSPRPSGRGCCGVDRAEWAAEVPEIRAFFERFGGRLPAELERSLSALEQDLTRVAT